MLLDNRDDLSDEDPIPRYSSDAVGDIRQLDYTKLVKSKTYLLEGNHTRGFYITCYT